MPVPPVTHLYMHNQRLQKGVKSNQHCNHRAMLQQTATACMYSEHVHVQMRFTCTHGRTARLTASHKRVPAGCLSSHRTPFTKHARVMSSSFDKRGPPTGCVQQWPECQPKFPLLSVTHRLLHTIFFSSLLPLQTN